MAALIQEVSRAARRTFCNGLKEPTLQENLNELVNLMNRVRGRDVNFNPALAESNNGDRAPVTYIHLFEDPVFSMGIFILKENSRIPLHDHPGMFGIIKVIHGTLCVESFDEVPLSTEQSSSTSAVKQLTSSFNNEFKKFLGGYKGTPKPFLEIPKLKASANDDCCVLTPTKGNVHEVCPHGGPAAFLDILAPPYDMNSDRKCFYYEKTKVQSTSSVSQKYPQNTSWLVQVQQPSDFWCEDAAYEGPAIPDH